jgi:hypothetical protein
MARFDPELSLWMRWLHVGCQLPLEHVAAVLGRECSLVTSWFETHVRHVRFIPSGPPRRARRPGPQTLISGRTGTRIRILRDLGYTADRIASVLAIPLEETADFLGRIQPIRRATLQRPRPRKRKPLPFHPDDLLAGRQPLALVESPPPEPAPSEPVPLAPREWVGPASRWDAPRPKRDKPPRRSRYPTEAVVCPHGVVRWDLPLLRDRGVEVTVHCECGREHLSFARTIKRAGDSFSGRCKQCDAIANVKKRKPRKTFAERMASYSYRSDPEVESVGAPSCIPSSFLPKPIIWTGPTDGEPGSD